METRVAIVTGGNKGIGLEIVKKLARAGLKTILTARDPALGASAASSLAELGDVEFRQLDITDSDSIAEFAAGFNRDFGKCDILVNNAAIAFKGSDPTPFERQCGPTFATNYRGTIAVTAALLPLLRLGTDARIVNVTSRAGALRILNNADLLQRVTAPDLTFVDIDRIAEEFQRNVEAGVHKERGWPSSNYGFSKLLVTAWSNVLARTEAPTITVNACCPGYCQTDMSSHNGNKTAEEGARTPFMLATADVGKTGKFFGEEDELVW